MAAFLSTFDLAACSGRDDSTAPRSSTTTSRASTSSTTAGGRYDVPEPEDVVACEQELARPGGFIFDVHTHHVVPDGPWRENARRIADMILGLVPSGCAEADPYRCVDRISYLHDMFLASDTTMTLLSDVPNSGPLDAPLPWEAKRETRSLASSLASPGGARVLLHDVIAPNFGDLSMRLDEMAATVATGDVAAFKVYTAWGPDRQGYALDDPALGIPVVEQARSLGVRVMCGHKGLPLLEFDRRFNGPRDLVALAARYPDMDFVVYHGAYEIQRREGPYDRDAATGIDTLVRALEDHGIGPNANVYAELGTTWREVLDSPDEAAHAVGKLLRYVGADNVLWGTDAVWYGSPQPQILAFRAFQITEAFQVQFGYPALTDDLKAKVFGLNAARLFDIDPDETRCALDADGLTAAREEAAGLVTEGALPAPWQARGPVSRRQILSWLGSAREPWTP